MSDRFVEISSLTDPMLEEFWLPLYREAFPADERVPEDEIRRAVVNSTEHLIVGIDKDRPVSMARYDVITDDAGSAFGYLMYMAVSPEAVSSGHGQQMFREVVRRLRSDDALPRLLLFEVQ